MIANESSDIDKALERVKSPDNLVNKLIERRKTEVSIEHRKMTGENSQRFPPMIQKLAMETARVTTQENAAATFGMTQENISYLENANTPKARAARLDVERSTNGVHSLALDAMLESISLLKPKLQGVIKATDLSTIAANLGRVVEKTTPKIEQQNNIKVVLFQPVMKGEESYEELVVSST